MFTKLILRISATALAAATLAGCATSSATDAASSGGGLSAENLQQIVDTAQSAIEGTAFASTGVGGACVVVLGLISAGLGWYARHLADEADKSTEEKSATDAGESSDETEAKK